jgi:hypothetical protein
MPYRSFALIAILTALFLSLIFLFPPRYETIEKMHRTNQAIEKLVEQYKASHPASDHNSSKAQAILTSPT